MSIACSRVSRVSGSAGARREPARGTRHRDGSPTVRWLARLIGGSSAPRSPSSLPAWCDTPGALPAPRAARSRHAGWPRRLGVQGAALLVEQPLIGRFLSEGVLERVLDVREKSALVEELRRLEPAERSRERLARLLSDILKERERDIAPDDRRRLEQTLVLRGKAIDARTQEGLSGGRDVQSCWLSDEAVPAALPGERADLDSVRTLSSRKNGLPSVLPISSGRRGIRLGSLPRIPSRRASAFFGPKRVDAELPVPGLATPCAVRVLGPVIDEQEHARAPAGHRPRRPGAPASRRRSSAGPRTRG